MKNQPKGALADLTILDLTRVVAGPYCGAILGDLGANVIKIEIPGSGDDARSYAPHVNGESAYFANLNRNKLGITLNLKKEKGKDIFRRLVQKSDVVIENFRPGVMERLGLGYEELSQINERLIYAAVSGFGSYGRYKERPGYDIISQAVGGLMSLTGQRGDPPTRTGNAMGDILGGMNLAIGILAAIHARTLTGRGQKVDVALIDSVVSSLENAFTRYFDSGEVPIRNGNAYASIAPYDSYMAQDGYVVIGCGNQKLFEIFCKEILLMPELIDDERFLTIPLRVSNNEALKEYIEQRTMEHCVEELVSMLLEKGIPASPIYDLSQIVADEHISKDREMFVEIDHPVIGRRKINGIPIKLTDTKPTIGKPAPTIGQHNYYVFGELLGMTTSEIEELTFQEVI
jgi:formyl-CoA transferase